MVGSLQSLWRSFLKCDWPRRRPKRSLLKTSAFYFQCAFRKGIAFPFGKEGERIRMAAKAPRRHRALMKAENHFEPSKNKTLLLFDTGGHWNRVLG